MDQRCKVWVDVGGTFTDCFVTDAIGNRYRGKVLSSAITKGVVTERSSTTSVIAKSLIGLCDHFWVGAQLTIFDERAGRSTSGIVTGFHSAEGKFELDLPLDFVPAAGSMLELNCGIEAPVLAVRKLLRRRLDAPLPPLDVRLGTTRGTNALLTRTGANVALVTTKGFGDVLRIASQERPELFRLDVQKLEPLTQNVIEIDERIAADGTILRELSAIDVQTALEDVFAKGIRSLAICLLNAYQHNLHELAVEKIAQEIGFTDVSVSSTLSPLIKLVSRAETTTLDAYLNPILATYATRVWSQFGGPDQTSLRLMTSAGQLVRSDAFRGCDSVLSGPAGGVVALAALGDALQRNGSDLQGVIGFDMGGTSTDVSRYEGVLVRQFEARKAGVRVMTPMMSIHTVAAGGGSICSVDGGRLFVGPESAGSSPGPACYGSGGPLTVTDLNLVLGRIVDGHFPFRLDLDAANQKLEQALETLAEGGLHFRSREELAEGFWRIAVNHMAEAVRTVTLAEGSNPKHLGLVSFGGAAGQHACAVAESLGMKTVIDHPDASVFSALGMGLAPVGRTASKGIYLPTGRCHDDELRLWIQQLILETSESLAAEVPDGSTLNFRATVEMRYAGNESTLAVDVVEPTSISLQDLVIAFGDLHQKSFGYVRRNRDVEVVTVRVDAEHRSRETIELDVPSLWTRTERFQTRQIFMHGKWIDADFVVRESLVAGDEVAGPAIVTGEHSTLIVHQGWTARMHGGGTLIAVHQQVAPQADVQAKISNHEEAIELELVARRLEAIAEQMGEVLRRTSVSVNVKERLDYSCAIFNREGYLIAGAMHVPVHLGAMGHTVRSLMAQYPVMHDGDCYVSNNPYAGGSHLPDVTIVSPVFVENNCDAQDSTPQNSMPTANFFVASRAHHAEIGGLTPGSMPPGARTLEEEGVVIHNFALVRNGVSFESELEKLLRGAKYPSRNPSENLADIAAQVAAGRCGAEDVRKLAEQQGAHVLQRRMTRLLDISADSIVDVIRLLGDAPQHFTDTLSDDSKISVCLTKQSDRLSVDFGGTSPVHPGGWNATPAIVSAALLYVLRCLNDRPLPLCEGVLRRMDLRIPSGLLNPPMAEPVGSSPAVVAGNVETSQRVVDCLLGAIGAAAASQGTMNNLLIGDSTFGYYETICGGVGATSHAQGADAVHSHMTNTRITDPEILESRFPMRLWRFAIRHSSGGAGKHRGGDGVVREIEMLRRLTVSMLTSRRGTNVPYGLHGGKPGKPGRNILVQTDGSRIDLPGSFSRTFEAGERIRIETPGGGGFGAADLGQPNLQASSRNSV